MFLCVGVFVSYTMYMCTVCVPGAQGGQKRALGFLDLELQKVMSHKVGPGNETLVFRKSSKTS